MLWVMSVSGFHLRLQGCAWAWAVPRPFGPSPWCAGPASGTAAGRTAVPEPAAHTPSSSGDPAFPESSHSERRERRREKMWEVQEKRGKMLPFTAQMCPSSFEMLGMNETKRREQSWDKKDLKPGSWMVFYTAVSRPRHSHCSPSEEFTRNHSESHPESASLHLMENLLLFMQHLGLPCLRSSHSPSHQSNQSILVLVKQSRQGQALCLQYDHPSLNNVAVHASWHSE